MDLHKSYRFQSLVPATVCPLALGGLRKRGTDILGSRHGAVASPVSRQPGYSEFDLPYQSRHACDDERTCGRESAKQNRT